MVAQSKNGLAALRKLSANRNEMNMHINIMQINIMHTNIGPQQEDSCHKP